MIWLAVSRGGWIAPLSAREAGARPPKARDRATPVSQRVRWGLAAAFPIALLSLVVSLILAPAKPAEGPQVFPISRAPLSQAKLAFEKRRLRHALEAERMLVGGWPESIADSDLARETADTLTASGSGDYYYARRGNGIILLAPEQHIR